MLLIIFFNALAAFAAGAALGLIAAYRAYKRGRVDGVKRATEVVRRFVENEKRREQMLKCIARDQECRSAEEPK